MDYDRDAIEGCSNGSCIYGPPQGQHTNGACQCLRDLPPRLRLRAERNWRLLKEAFLGMHGPLETCDAVDGECYCEIFRR